MSNEFAVIFDMDGVLVDNFTVHLDAWNLFCKKHHIAITEHELKHHAFGRTNEELLPQFFGKALTKNEIDQLADDKEQIYRDLYKGKVALIEGLHLFLSNLKAHNIPVAVATSAPAANARFVLNETGTAHLFKSIIDVSMVQKGKPDPEIYTKAAQVLGFEANRCLVFEDSFAGIESATRAGMAVVGVATTHAPDKLAGCVTVINNYNTCTTQWVEQLLS